MAIINGTNGADVLTGTIDPDTLNGFDGNDILIGGLAADTLSGGLGDDTYIWSLGDGNDTIDEVFQGGFDTLRFNGLTLSSANFSILVGPSDIQVVHVPSGATLTLQSQTSNISSVVERLQFLNYNFDMTFGFGISGGAAAETVYGGLFRDVLRGGAGNDTINGRDGDDTAFGGTENDTLNGEGGADILYGEAGTDSLNGGDGDDRLIGGAGNDTLNGGNGVGDFAWYFGETSAVTVNLATGSATGATIGTDTLFNIESVFGSEANDLITGSTLANTVNGAGGTDTINGGDGDDRLLGGAGGDTINGDAGNDTIFGDEPFSPSQTSTALGVTQTGAPLAISLTGARWDPDTSTSVSGFVGTDAPGSSQINVVFVIDRSGSMNDLFQGAETVPDLNGDGLTNTLMDGAIAAFTALNQSIIAAGLGSIVNVTVAAFSSSSFVAYSGPAGRDQNNNGLADVVDALRTLTASGGTSYDLGLQEAIGALQATPNGANYVFFTSDGFPNGGPYNDEVSALLSTFNANIRAIGLGDGASLADLDIVDDLSSNGSAERALAPSQLTAALTRGNIDPSTIDRVEISVNGVLAQTIPASQLVATPFGLQFTADLTGLSASAADVITARVFTSGANAVSLATSLTVAQVDPATGGNDILSGGDGNDVIDANAGADTLNGNNGDDILIGGPGNDALNGGAGRDVADYSQELQDVTVNLLTQTATGVASGTDTLNSIENATGGGGNDTLTAFNGILVVPDIIKPAGLSNNAIGTSVSLAGSFGLHPNPNITNADTVPHATVVASGSNGAEFYSFTGAAGATVTIDIDATSSSFDSRVFLLNAAGTQLATNDDGGALDPGSSTTRDSFLTFTLPSTGTYYVRVEAFSGTIVPTGAQYTLNVSVTGATLATTGSLLGSALTGNAGADILLSGQGADRFDGGAGSDTVSYANGTSGVYVFFGDLGGATNSARGDQFISIENITGSAFADIIGMDGLNNTINGAQGADRLFGQGGDDILIGGAGGDELQGGEGFDRVSYATAGAGVYAFVGDFGAATGDAAGDLLIDVEGMIGSAFADILGMGNDDNIIDGGAGADQLYGQGGNDILIGGAGGDVLFGGTGLDTASYVTAAAGVYAFLGDLGNATGDAAGDVFSSIENLTGSAFNDILGMGNDNNTIDGGAGNDRLFGQGGADTLIGGTGNDELIGGAGADVLIGGDGRDIVSYATAAAGVYAFAGDFGAATGDAAGDQLFSVEDLRGSAFADILGMGDDANMIDGGAGDDQLYGQGGDDILIGGAGRDVLFGGSGVDTASYVTSLAGVYAFLGDLGNATADAIGDTFVSIENITGSAFNDVLGLDDNANTLSGGAGNDSLFGLGGDDVLIGGTGADVLNGGVGTRDVASYVNAASGVYVFFGDLGSSTGEAAGDQFIGIEGLTGSAFNDILGWDGGANILNGGAGDDQLFGQGGGDVLNGGEGNDTASYATGGQGVYVFFGDLGSATGDAAGDSFISIENITGTAFADIIGMDNGDNIINGGGGDDRLFGQGGNDTLIGGAGADRYVYVAAGFGNDRIVAFEDGVDRVDFSSFLQINFNNLVITQDVGGVLVQVGSDSIFLGGVTVGQITAADFIFGGP